MTEAQRERQAARIDPAVDERLRLAATVSGKRVGRYLTDLLNEHLPSHAELAALISQRGEQRDDSDS
jgi:hypothetical protein